MSIECFDIHQHVTEKIVCAIERGAGDFRLPWHRSVGSIMRPVNVASKKPYRGVNVVALWAYAEEPSYSSGVWGTYRQWSKAGAQVRKGALVRTGLTPHNLPADCSNDRADECSTWTNSSKAAISIAK
jgi:antirestriction protein ArdC